MKRNSMCYLMLLPFMIFFLFFTVIPELVYEPRQKEAERVAERTRKYSEDERGSYGTDENVVFEEHGVEILKTVFYAPSMAGNIYFVWQLIFSGDAYGYLNAVINEVKPIGSAMTTGITVKNRKKIINGRSMR